MPTMELSKEGNVHILTLTNGAGENRFTADVIREYNAALDEMEAFPGNTALVVASSDPKFWCNGINLEWIMTQPREWAEKNFGRMLDKLFLRFALLNMPTIGCLNGHTYAGGAALAATFDFRFMRADRGFFCFPEVDIGIPFTPIMQQILNFLPDHLALTELLLTGRRVGGLEARDMKIVMAAYPLEELRKKTMEMAGMLALKDRATFAAIKRNMRRTLADILNNWKD